LLSLGLNVAVRVRPPSVANVRFAEHCLLPALPLDSEQVPRVPSTSLLKATVPCGAGSELVGRATVAAQLVAMFCGKTSGHEALIVTVGVFGNGVEVAVGVLVGVLVGPGVLVTVGVDVGVHGFCALQAANGTSP
jgi:hypothetical protein